MVDFAVIEAPSILGLKPTGVDGLPDALLGAGLGERLGARWAGRVSPTHPYDPDRETDDAVLNAAAIVDYSPRLADAIGAVVDGGEFPVVLGGDCSILLGGTLALRRRGCYGLLFIDGHADFYQPEANPNGEAASMDLALATGRGPALLTGLEGRRPLIRDADAVIFGFRDAEEQREYGSQPLPPEILAIDLADVRRDGVEATARSAMERLAHPGLDGFWIHLDADVLDDAVMPAVDYRMPGGFSFAELTRVLQIALATGRAVGIEVTIFNPSLDPEGSIARAFTKCLVDGLTSASR